MRRKLAVLNEVVDREYLGVVSTRDRYAIRDKVEEIANGWMGEIDRLVKTGWTTAHEDRLPCRVPGADAKIMRLVRLYFREMGYRTGVICDGNRDTRYVEWSGVVPLTVAEGCDAG